MSADNFLSPNGDNSTPVSVTTNGTLRTKGIVVFSGGSAANNLVDVFKKVREDKKCPLSYVIPISDNGGSSSELIRVFGGPGIGDVRSRLVRLIPDDPDHDDSEKAAIKTFFNHRLPKERSSAREEWLQIVEAEHALWTNISTAKKELVRSILNVVAYEIVKRRRPSSSFDFSGASIGNLFLTGARLFTGSFESAIYLLSSICSVPSHTSVLPAINTNFTHHISVSLANGDTITGQNSISHPSISTALVPGSDAPAIDETEQHDRIEDANLPGSLPTLRKQYITFSKADEEELPARIQRLWYINPYGQEIRLSANPTVLSALNDAQAVIYSIGSLYTSIIPSLVLKGIGEAIRNPAIRYKILILNSTIDRETGPSSHPYSALDFVAAIAKACEESRNVFAAPDRSLYRNVDGPELHADMMRDAWKETKRDERHEGRELERGDEESDDGNEEIPENFTFPWSDGEWAGDGSLFYYDYFDATFPREGGYHQEPLFVWELMTNGLTAESPLEQRLEWSPSDEAADLRDQLQVLEEARLGSILLKAWKGEYESAEQVAEDIMKTAEQVGISIVRSTVEQDDDWVQLFKDEVDIGEPWEDVFELDEAQEKWGAQTLRFKRKATHANLPAEERKAPAGP
ncbi:hypothetical protein ACET3X_004624 [Alternaria dauci]|uniref:Uncharacterized protein n=1 Tax=Alternaria dauci TaxID=48095 RepID=A0ABR3UNF6_9PLEO